MLINQASFRWDVSPTTLRVEIRASSRYIVHISISYEDNNASPGQVSLNMSKISKIILFRDDSFFFSIKKAPHEPIKDGKLELPGGHVDEAETPLQGMIRELAEEEESGLIADKVALLRLTPLEIMVEGDPHFIYHMAFTGKEMERIRMSTKESYGYRLIPRSTIADPQRMDYSVFTRKTLKIFNELKRLRYFPYDRV